MTGRAPFEVPRAQLELFTALVLFLLLHVVVGAALAAFGPAVEPGEPLPRAALELAFGVQLAVQVVLLLAVALVPARVALRGRGRTWTAIPAYLAFLLLWIPVAFYAVPAVWRALGWEIEPQPHLEFFTGPLDGGAFVIAVLAACFVGPVFEEVLFRGYLQTGLRDLLGPREALVLSSLLFGLVHVGHGWHLLVPLTLMGGLFGWLRQRTDGLLAPILAHCLHNGLTVAVTVSFPETLNLTSR